VVVDRDALYQAAFEHAVALLEPDLLFAGRLDEYEALRNLHYGSGFERFAEEVRAEYLADQDGSPSRRREGLTRLEILGRSYLRYQRLAAELKRWSATPASGIQEAVQAEGRLYLDQDSGRYVFTDQEPRPGWRYVGTAEVAALLRHMPEAAQQRFWGKTWIDGRLTMATLATLNDEVEKEYQRLKELPPYGFEVLSRVRDYKVLIALRYLVEMCRALGFESQLDPVLSFPLGSNVVSVLEVARAYEAIRSGRLFLSGLGNIETPLAIIDRIEDAEGKTLFRPQRGERRVVDPRIALAVSDVLRNVVLHGTGRYAERNLRLHSRDPEKEEQLRLLDLKVPVFGKTGTANRFANAAFAGFLPGRADSAVSLESGYVLAAYVGFDDNRPMVRNSTHITGASGALPLWTSLAETIFKERRYAASLDLADLSFSNVERLPLKYPDLGQVAVPVDEAGLAAMPQAGDGGGERDVPEVITFGKLQRTGGFEPARFFQPFWQAWEAAER